MKSLPKPNPARAVNTHVNVHYPDTAQNSMQVQFTILLSSQGLPGRLIASDYMYVPALWAIPSRCGALRTEKTARGLWPTDKLQPDLSRYSPASRRPQAMVYRVATISIPTFCLAASPRQYYRPFKGPSVIVQRAWPKKKFFVDIFTNLKYSTS